MMQCSIEMQTLTVSRGGINPCIKWKYIWQTFSRRLNPAGRRPWSRSSPAPPESPDPAASAPLPVPGLASSSPRPPTSTRATMDGRCVRVDCGRTRASDAYGPASVPPLMLLLSSAMCSPSSSCSRSNRERRRSICNAKRISNRFFLTQI